MQLSNLSNKYISDGVCFAPLTARNRAVLVLFLSIVQVVLYTFLAQNLIINICS